MLRLKSNKTGKNKSAYLRELIRGSCPVEAPSKKFYDAVNELNKIGLNINQLAFFMPKCFRVFSRFISM